VLAPKKRLPKPNLAPVQGWWINDFYLPAEVTAALATHLPPEDSDPTATATFFKELSRGMQEFELLRSNVSAAEIREPLQDIGSVADGLLAAVARAARSPEPMVQLNVKGESLAFGPRSRHLLAPAVREHVTSPGRSPRTLMPCVWGWTSAVQRAAEELKDQVPVAKIVKVSPVNAARVALTAAAAYVKTYKRKPPPIKTDGLRLSLPS
jgi:hypothetical protein